MNNNKMSCNLIIILLSIVIGMIVGTIWVHKVDYHGTNATNFCKRIYRSRKTGQCYKFSIKLLPCKKNTNHKFY